MNGTQLTVPHLSPINKLILLMAVGLFILQSVVEKILGLSLLPYLGLSSGFFFGGHLYQIATYPMVQTGLLNMLFDGLVIWFIGSDLERLWGPKSYLKFLLISLLSAGLFYLLIAGLFSERFPLAGITGMSYALLLAYAVLFPDRILTFMLIFPMKARYFCLLLVGVLLFSGIMGNNSSSWGHLGAMFGAFGYMYAITLYRQGKRPLQGIFRRCRSKANLRIVRDDDDEPKYWH